MCNATTQELSNRNRTIAENLCLNGISPLYTNRRSDLLIGQIRHVDKVANGEIDLSPVELANRLGLEVHIEYPGEHGPIYFCTKTMKEIKPTFSAYGMLLKQKRLLCPRCLKGVPFVTADDLGQVIKGDE